MPSGSRPLTGSSRTSADGSPSSAAARPSLRPIPSEYVETRLPAASAMPTSSSISSTRAFPIPAERATQRRWARPVRERCAPDPSSTAPILRNGSRSDANGLPSTRAVPEVAWSRPSRMRSVEDFPAPLGPRNPVTRPGFAVKVMSERIVRDPRCLVT